mmetsp:Transcript_126248/g.252186  ORF Transcript_126248/g.252186 Transcript_126248/m.252186 type:complete len:102 (+) Transcript_126248:2184-2489(+)
MVVVATTSETSAGTPGTDSGVGDKVDSCAKGRSETVPKGSDAREQPGVLSAELPVSKSGAAAVGPAVAEDEDAQGLVLRMLSTKSGEERQEPTKAPSIANL